MMMSEPRDAAAAQGGEVDRSGAGSHADAQEGKETKWRKAALRQEALCRRAAMTPEQRAQASRRAAEHLRRMPAYQEAATVALFLSFGDEIDTWIVLHMAQRDGKRVYAPKVSRHPRMLLWGEVGQEGDNLVPGPYKGIMEPEATLPPGTFQPDLVVVPGVVFDDDGYRIGYGGGYYDRCLGGWPDAVKVGYAFEVQRVPRVPREPHDVPVSWLVTETGVHRLGPSRPAQPAD